MAARDDDRFRPKVAPPKARGSSRAPKFTSRVLKAASKIGPASGGTLRRQSSRGGARFGRGMAGIGDDGELCFCPGFFKVPGAARGANNIISTLDDMAWNMLNFMDIF